MARPIRLFHLIDRARTELFARANAETTALLGVSVSQLALLFAVRDAAPHRPRDLAAIMEVDPAAVTRLVDRLEAAGLVTRVADPEDGRSRRVKITAAGSAVRERGAQLVARANRRLAAPFTAEELDVVARFLEHVIDDGHGETP